MSQLRIRQYLDNPNCNLFGLKVGQIRPPGHLFHNAGWYNFDGHRLGWGDLDEEDIQRISNEIDGTEAFYILQENDSNSPSDASGHLELDSPGQEYISDHTVCMITSRSISFFYERIPKNHLEYIKQLLPNAQVVCLGA